MPYASGGQGYRYSAAGAVQSPKPTWAKLAAEVLFSKMSALLAFVVVIGFAGSVAAVSQLAAAEIMVAQEVFPVYKKVARIQAASEQVLGETAYPSQTLTSSTNRSLNVTVTPKKFDPSRGNAGEWLYEISWKRTLQREGSIRIYPRTQVANKLLSINAGPTGSAEFYASPSASIRVNFYSLTEGKGSLLLGKYFTIKAAESQAGFPGYCTFDVFICPDGSYVSRVAPSCQFPSCPQVTPAYGYQTVPVPMDRRTWAEGWIESVSYGSDVAPGSVKISGWAYDQGNPVKPSTILQDPYTGAQAYPSYSDITLPPREDMKKYIKSKSGDGTDTGLIYFVMKFENVKAGSYYINGANYNGKLFNVHSQAYQPIKIYPTPTPPVVCSPIVAPPPGCYYDGSSPCGGNLVCKPEASTVLIDASKEGETGTVGKFYSASFTAYISGYNRYSFGDNLYPGQHMKFTAEGALPPGVKLSNRWEICRMKYGNQAPECQWQEAAVETPMFAELHLAGIPTQPGTYEIILKAVYGQLSAVKKFNITIFGDNNIYCPKDVNICPDGTYVVRDPDNNCQFKACPLASYKPYPDQCNYLVAPSCPDGSKPVWPDPNSCGYTCSSSGSGPVNNTCPAVSLSCPYGQTTGSDGCPACIQAPPVRVPLVCNFVTAPTCPDGSSPIFPDSNSCSYVCKTNSPQPVTCNYIAPPSCLDGSKPIFPDSNSCSYTCPTNPGCQILWWHDSSRQSCSQKQFCGTYMYYGLQTFNTEDACNISLMQRAR